MICYRYYYSVSYLYYTVGTITVSWCAAGPPRCRTCQPYPNNTIGNTPHDSSHVLLPYQGREWSPMLQPLSPPSRFSLVGVRNLLSLSLLTVAGPSYWQRCPLQPMTPLLEGTFKTHQYLPRHQQHTCRHWATPPSAPSSPMCLRGRSVMWRRENASSSVKAFLRKLRVLKWKYLKHFWWVQ